MKIEERKSDGGVSAGLLELGECIQGKASPGERFFSFLLPTPGRERDCLNKGNGSRSD
jgi:hypothetical protein